MSLTTAQGATLEAAIRANPALTQLVADRRDDLIAAYYNEPASPTVTVWRTAVPRVDAQAEGFDWTQVDNLTTGQSRIWFDALFGNGFVNAADAGQRAGIAEAWKGTAAKVAVATFVLGKCKRAATRAEALFATGTGSVAVPAVMTFEGNVQPSEVSDLLNRE
jgi:hypothetical protein